MGFITKCFIRKNTPELREKLRELGYCICKCCTFENAVWLDNFFSYDEKNKRADIHGIGYFDADYEKPGYTVEDALNFYLYENKEYGEQYVDCGENEDLFLALAGMRDDVPDNQWFVWVDDGTLRQYINDGSWQEWWWFEVRRATKEEIIEHFKNKK